MDRQMMSLEPEVNSFKGYIISQWKFAVDDGYESCFKAKTVWRYTFFELKKIRHGQRVA